MNFFVALAIAASAHFRLQPLAGGVWAAIATHEGHAVSNAGIVDLGDRTLVFDSFMTREAAADLARAARELTGGKPLWLVYSHGHDDHVRGGPAIGAAKVIATAQIAGAVRRDEQTFAAENADAAARLEQWKREYSAAPSDESRLWVSYGESILSSLRDYHATLPDEVFEGRRKLGRRAELIALSGHTASDVVLVLPDDGIVFCGDLLFVWMHPWLGDGNVDALLKSLDRLAALKARAYVPGHGEVGTLQDVAALKQYVLDVRSGGPDRPGWGLARFHAANVRAFGPPVAR